MEGDCEGGDDEGIPAVTTDCKLRSGVRSGLKREFAFAVKSQSEIPASLGRTRSRRSFPSSSTAKRTKLTNPAPVTVRNTETMPPTTPCRFEAEIAISMQEEMHPEVKNDTEDKKESVLDVAALDEPKENILPSKRLKILTSEELKTEGGSGNGVVDAIKEEEDNKGGGRFSSSPLKDKDEAVDGLGNSPSPTKNLELKMSKKISITKLPGNVRDLLGTGLLEGQAVKYVGRKLSVLHGVIAGNSILCSCATCNGLTAISPFNFELHAGSTKKHPSENIFLENGKSLRDILMVGMRSSLDMLEAAIQNAIAPIPEQRSSSCKKCRNSFCISKNGKVSNFCPSCLESEVLPETSSPLQKISIRSRKRWALSQGSVSDSNLSKNVSTKKKPSSAGKLTKKDVRLHKLVFSDASLPEGIEVGYYVRGKKLLDGYIKDSGIFCNCCMTVISPSQFEAHAGQAPRRKPYNYIYTSNGVSLHELSISLAKNRKIDTNQTDDLCSICSDGGNLLICDICPRAFHKECLGLSSVPEGEWYCTHCQNLEQRDKCLASNDNAKAAGRIDGVDPIEQIFQRCVRVVRASEDEFGGCAFCKLHDFSRTFGDRTVLLCDQCEKEYHVGCLREHNLADLQELPAGKWFCSVDCNKIHSSLANLIVRGAELIPVACLDTIKKKREGKVLSVDGHSDDISWKLLSGRDASGETKHLLSKAVSIFHESFDPVVEFTTGRDLIPSMVYGWTNRDQDYSGMHCAILISGSTVVSAALLRVMGRGVAELPLAATSRDTQGQGYFQCLFSCIERLLASLHVKHFVLPAADEAESIWTKKFGFTKITTEELKTYLSGARMTVFHGVSILHKLVPSLELSTFTVENSVLQKSVQSEGENLKVEVRE